MTISPAYLAFKALEEGADGRLVSPSRGTPWGLDSQGRPTLVANPGDVDSGRGIYAATWQVAADYGSELYLVSPSAEGVEDDVVLSYNGWRSASATVVGGPYARSDAGVAAGVILAAWHQGYPQLQTILQWAALLLYDADAAAEALAGAYNGSYELYRAGLLWPDESWDPVISEALARSGDSDELYLAGCLWPASRWTPAIAEALARSGDSKALYRAGRDWPDERWDPAIAEALIGTGDGSMIYLAGCDWPVSRRTPEITRRLMEAE